MPADVARDDAAVEVDPAARAGADDQRDGAAFERLIGLRRAAARGEQRHRRAQDSGMSGVRCKSQARLRPALRIPAHSRFFDVNER